MPACRSSMAREAPKEDRNDFVAAYSAVIGETIAAAADDVNTTQPLSFLATYDAQTQHLL